MNGPYMSHHSSIVLEPAKRRTSLDASPKRTPPVFTDTRPNSTVDCWQIWYFVFIEREARPNPYLTPVTSRRPVLPPGLTLSPLSPSSHAYRLWRIQKRGPCLRSFPKLITFDFFIMIWLFVLSTIYSSSIIEALWRWLQNSEVSIGIFKAS